MAFASAKASFLRNCSRPALLFAQRDGGASRGALFSVPRSIPGAAADRRSFSRSGTPETESKDSSPVPKPRLCGKAASVPHVKAPVPASPEHSAPKRQIHPPSRRKRRTESPPSRSPHKVQVPRLAALPERTAPRKPEAARSLRRRMPAQITALRRSAEKRMKAGSRLRGRKKPPRPKTAVQPGYAVPCREFFRILPEICDIPALSRIII